MPSLTLTNNGSTTPTTKRTVGQLFALVARGSLGGGILEVRYQSGTSDAATLEQYTAADQNSDGVIHRTVAVPVDTSLIIRLVNATAPNVVIDYNVIETLRSN